MDDPGDEGPIKLTAADLGRMRMKKKYVPAPEVVEFKLPEFYQVLPHVRCLNCNGNIFRQSQLIMEGIQAEQELTMKKKGRGMSADELSNLRAKLLEEANFRRPCCMMNSVEQLVIPDDVPQSSDRYVPGLGKMRGNVRIRKIPKEIRANAPIPYNPYTVSAKNIKFEDDDEEEAIKRVDVSKFSPPIPFSDVYPSMPPIDDTFTEEEAPTFKPEGREHVAGIVYTGVPGMESILVRGRAIPAL